MNHAQASVTKGKKEIYISLHGAVGPVLDIQLFPLNFVYWNSSALQTYLALLNK